jgi:hypothetical protein
LPLGLWGDVDIFEPWDYEAWMRLLDGIDAERIDEEA